MILPNKLASELLDKDRAKAQHAASHIINSPDIEAWKCLVENGEYLFDYIKEKAGHNLINSFNKENLFGLFQLMRYHSTDWDWIIAEIFAKYQNQEIKSTMLELLNQGEPEEKAYAAKFFTLVKDDSAAQLLLEASKEDYEPLKVNSAQALGVQEDKPSYDYYINKLQSDDDWEKVEGAQFLANYGNSEAVIPILKAMESSKMAEHLAGEAAALTDLYMLFESESDEERELALEAFDNLLSGLSEIWGLAALFNFNIFESVEKLIELIKTEDSSFNSKYAQLLLKTKGKISMFMENSQYTFDEEKNVLNELNETYNLLNGESEDFWAMAKECMSEELNVNGENRKLAAISLIKEMRLYNAKDNLKRILSNSEESELVLCESFLALILLGDNSVIQEIDAILSRISDPNLVALMHNAIAVRK